MHFITIISFEQPSASPAHGRLSPVCVRVCRVRRSIAPSSNRREDFALARHIGSPGSRTRAYSFCILPLTRTVRPVEPWNTIHPNFFSEKTHIFLLPVLLKCIQPPGFYTNLSLVVMVTSLTRNFFDGLQSVRHIQSSGHREVKISICDRKKCSSQQVLNVDLWISKRAL